MSHIWTKFCVGCLLLIAGIAGAQQTTTSDRLKAHIVSRTYQLTYGGIEMCRRIAPQQVAQVEAEVSRFQKTYPELMALIDKSSFLDAAKRQNAQTVEGMAESVAKNPDLARCDDVIAMLRQWVDHPEANSGIAEMIDELKK